MTEESPEAHDPAQAWAREHYGFEDDLGTQPTAPASPASQPGSLWTRPRSLIATGLVSLLLVGSVDGIAIAAADDGGPGGRDGGRGGIGAGFDDDGAR